MEDKYTYFSPSNKFYMVFIAVLIVVLYAVGQFVPASVALVGYGILVIYNIQKSKEKKNEWKKFIEDFSSKLDLATQNTLVKLPFPLIIIGAEGNILWYNKNFQEILKEDDVLGENIQGILKDFNTQLVLEEKKTSYLGVELKGKYYDLYTSIIEMSDKNSSDRIILAYFYDVTEFEVLNKKFEEEKNTVLLIEVDNLDEVIKSTEEDKKPLLIAEVERSINAYAQSLSALVKKYASNKYILVVQDKHIVKEIEKKFDILDTVREINNGNTLAVTLSVGVGRGAESPLENYNLAMSAKELALGRGGDQVVVKRGDRLSFYGGKTKEFEKRTKVRARVIAHALVDLINESSKVFIMGHKNADIDCLGAAIGLYSTVRSLDVPCSIILEQSNGSIQQVLDEFNADKDYENAFTDNEGYRAHQDDNTLLVLVDVHSKGYVQNYDLVKHSKRIVIIDHHRRSADAIEGALLTYVEPYASSTSEMVTEMIQYMTEKPKLKRIEAEALLAGICVDTKNFYFKTGVRTFEAAGFLRRLGADTIEVKRLFADNLDTFIKRAEILKTAKVENGVAIAACPPEIEDPVLAAQAADELLNITGIQSSFVLVKIENEVLISGRSLGEVNVQLILESLGGGGHMTIAGTRLLNITLEEAEKKLRDAIDKYLREGEKK